MLKKKTQKLKLQFIFRNETVNMNDLDREWRQRTIKTEITNGRPMFFV